MCKASLVEKKVVFGYKFVSVVSGIEPLNFLAVVCNSGNKWELSDGTRILTSGSMPQVRNYVYTIHCERIELLQKTTV